MQRRTRARPGRRSILTTQIALVFFVFLALASVPIQPSSEAFGAIPLDSSPRFASAPALAGSATPAIVSPGKSLSGPRAVPGQPPPDGNTIALYHFDSADTITSDDTGYHPGTVHGNATVASSGLYSGALSVDGAGSYIDTGKLPTLSQGTIEVYVDFAEACNAYGWTYPIISAGSAPGGSDLLQIRVNYGLDFGIYSDGQWHWADSGINACRYLSYGPSAPGWPYETWRFHHVAVTWGPRGMEIWVDGVLHGLGTNDPNAVIWPYKYMCNPQMQLGVAPAAPNPKYPVCPLPLMATIGGYPPGDYTGGLPSAYWTIGCGNGSCFKGRLDEVRISNVQRTNTVAVVPTITPMPTQTPVAIGGQYSPDANTQALYHGSPDAWFGGFHHELNAVDSGWDARLLGNSNVVSDGRFDTGMTFDGSLQAADGYPSMLFLEPSAISLGTTGTFEAWVNLSGTTSGTGPLFVAGGSGDSLRFGFYPAGTLMLGLYDSDSDKFVWNKTRILPSDITGSWHHVASTWGSRGMEVWLDGALCSVQQYSGTLPSLSAWLGVGCDRDGHCMKGTIDEVRISSLQRTFAPAPLQMQRVARSNAENSSPFSLFLPLIDLMPTPTPPACSPLN